MSRRFGIAAVILVALVALAAALLLWRRAEPPTPPPVVEAPARLDLEPARFADLPGWSDDSSWRTPAAGALAALHRSCAVFAALPDDRPLGEGASSYAGTAADWKPLCAALPAAGTAPPAVRAFLADNLRPWAATDGGDPGGLFTGYYEPTLHGSRRRGGAYEFPLYTRPPELVSVDLGRFRDDLAGRRIAGRVEGGRLVPFADRGAIDSGALDGRGLELVWVDSAVDAFFLHIQGSGVVRLAEGGELRLGYAAQNGQPYRSLGRVLVERGEMELEDVSMQSLRRWLQDHPDRAAEAMATNPSYVFFRVLDGDGPVGSQGVVLTPGHSLAVDPAFHALGVPVWLAASAPAPDPAAPDRPLRSLLVAQDSGGAIRGPVRGDVFWGPGDGAAAVAGRMRHQGRMWLLLPRHLPGGDAQQLGGGTPDAAK